MKIERVIHAQEVQWITMGYSFLFDHHGNHKMVCLWTFLKIGAILTTYKSWDDPTINPLKP